MPLLVRFSLSALIVFSCFACLCLPATADSVNITGTAYGGNDSNGLSINGGGFSFWSAAPIGYSTVGEGTAGIPMNLSFYVLPWSGPGYADIEIGGKSTDILQGTGLLFTGTFTVPFSALAQGTFTAPLSVMGQLFAYQDLGNFTNGPLLASLLFTGSGSAEFQLLDLGNGQFVISSATFDFRGKGTLTVVPEPASLLLMGLGLAALGIASGMKKSGLTPVS